MCHSCTILVYHIVLLQDWENIRTHGQQGFVQISQNSGLVSDASFHKFAFLYILHLVMSCLPEA